jgi:hypothetical protein
VHRQILNGEQFQENPNVKTKGIEIELNGEGSCFSRQILFEKVI